LHALAAWLKAKSQASNGLLAALSGNERDALSPLSFNRMTAYGKS
jgi:hypothetical protein